MPLVIIAGNPCSGKTTVANQLVQQLKDDGSTVHLISENSLFSDRNKCYATLIEEKNTRSKLRSETERVLSRTSTVVLDSLNFVKGYRYELWCLARAAGTKCCVLWVNTPAETCALWNMSRNNEQAYSTDIFEDLSSRFEAPNPSCRWDSPLHVICPSDSKSSSETIIAVVNSLSPASDTKAISVGPLATVAHDLVPNLATAQPTRGSSSALHMVDRAAQRVLQCISDAQAAAPTGMGPGNVEILPGVDLDLSTPANAAELRRLKRAFVKTTTGGTCFGGSNGTLSGDVATRAFVGYLRDHMSCVTK